MPETLARNIDHIDAPSTSYQVVDMLTSDVVFDQALQTLEDKIQADPDLQDLRSLKMAQREAKAHEQEARWQSDEDTTRKYAAIVDELQDNIDSAPEDVKTQHAKIDNQIYWLSNGTRLVDSDSAEAVKIIDLIAAAPAVQPTPITDPPFKGFMDNDEQAWEHVPRSAVDEYLSNRVFVTGDRLPRTSGTNSILIAAQLGEELDVPVDIFVTAAGFDSWRGRGGARSSKRVSGRYQDAYEGPVSSNDVIKHYASLPSELPPVSDVEIFIQPDGVMFASNGGGDSHRIAAAILRGQETIKTGAIRITPIDYNFLPSSDSHSQEKTEVI